MRCGSSVEQEDEPGLPHEPTALPCGAAQPTLAVCHMPPARQPVPDGRSQQGAARAVRCDCVCMGGDGRGTSRGGSVSTSSPPVHLRHETKLGRGRTGTGVQWMQTGGRQRRQAGNLPRSMGMGNRTGMS
jgi:hypothetical protein